MITSRLDWYTVIVENVTFDQILRKIDFPVLDYESIELRQFADYKGQAQWAYTYESGMNFRVPMDELHRLQRDCIDESTGEVADFDLFFCKFSKVRVDFPGSALDYCRKYGFDVDYHFQDPFFWRDCSDSKDTEFHLTRVDFAFDFFNESDTFLNDFFRCLRNYQTREESTGSFGQYKIKNEFCSKPLRCSMKCSGSERTVYIGATTADKLLRIYDKYMESHKNGAWISSKIPWWIDIKPEDLKSWCRFELQLRRELCSVFLFDHAIPFSYKSAESMNFRDVLNHIFQYYLAYTPDDELNQVVRNFFDVSKLDRIEYHKPRQNANLVQLRGERAAKFAKLRLKELLNLGIEDGFTSKGAHRYNSIIQERFEKAVAGQLQWQRWIKAYDVYMNVICNEIGKKQFYSIFYEAAPLIGCSERIKLIRPDIVE